MGGPAARALGQGALCVALAYLAWHFIGFDDDWMGDHYAVLALPHSCTKEDVRAAYKRLALKYHPDKTRSLDASSQEKAKKLFLRVNEAHEILSDEQQRQRYDEMLKFQAQPGSHTEQQADHYGLGSGGGGPMGRSWSWWYHFVLNDMTFDLFLFLLWHGLSVHNLFLLLTTLGLISVGTHLLLTSCTVAFWAVSRTSATMFTTEAAKMEAHKALLHTNLMNRQAMLAARERQQQELTRQRNK